MLDTRAYAAFDSKSALRPHRIQRREPAEHDVLIEILYCGVCHSDLHQVRNEWAGSRYPMVPGHEIVGRVSRVGAKVTRFAPGDAVGVGCFVDSCRICPACKKGDEQYCDGPLAFTYNSMEKDGKTPTQGGYSSQITVDENYVLRVPKDAPLDKVAPLLCAGITTYSPLRHWKLSKGQRVAVLGLGGLGHMAVKFAAAMGAEVTLLSSSQSKKADATRLGAHDFALTSNEASLSALQNRFDLLVDTVSAPHDIARFAQMLRTDGVMVLLGAPEKPATLPAFALIPRRRSIAGSLIGGIRETQEMLDFCAARSITADVETISIQDIDGAFDRMLKGDVRYRFVINAESLKRS
jgi:alcohol dehydrogenase (NADP+)